MQRAPVVGELRLGLTQASYDGRVYRWETDLDRALDFACQMAGRNLTEEEWADFLPEQPYREVCPGL